MGLTHQIDTKQTKQNKQLTTTLQTYKVLILEYTQVLEDSSQYMACMELQGISLFKGQLYTLNV